MLATRRPVEAVLIAGGLGTRMLPLTERRPKHLLDVGGVPFSEHQIAKLAGAGVSHIVLATSYHADRFEPVLGDGSRFGLRLTYVREDEPLGTGGAIRNAAPALSGDPDGAVVVLNGDVLSGHDLRAQLAGFATERDGRPVDVSLHLVEVPDARAFGCVPTDREGRVEAFLEKSERPVTNQVNAGCYVFRRRVLEEIPAGRVVSVERETFPGLIARDALVVGHRETAYWRDVGSPEALVAASRDVVLGVAPSAAVGPAPGGARVHPGARVSGEVGGGAVVGEGAEVGLGARVLGSVVMAGARVGTGALVADSALGVGAVVADGAVVRGAAVGDEASVAPGAVLGPGARVGCGSRAR